MQSLLGQRLTFKEIKKKKNSIPYDIAFWNNNNNNDENNSNYKIK